MSQITIRFSDPGLYPKVVTVNQGIEVTQALANESAYTSACVTVDSRDYWLCRFLNTDTWLPSTLHVALQPYFLPEDV